jgi:hypothetical protein
MDILARHGPAVFDPDDAGDDIRDDIAGRSDALDATPADDLAKTVAQR